MSDIDLADDVSYFDMAKLPMFHLTNLRSMCAAFLTSPLLGRDNKSDNRLSWLDGLWGWS